MKYVLNWNDEAILPNGQIVVPKVIAPDECHDLVVNHWPSWQREFDDGKRDGYEKAMKEGEWMNCNMSLLRFTPDGEILDGTHRLSAADRAKFTLVALVLKNVPHEAYITTDTHKSRKASDFIAGPDRKLLSTLSEMFYRATCGASPFSSSGVGSSSFAMNNNDPAAFLHANRDKIESIARIAARNYVRCNKAVTSRTWGYVAAVARKKTGSDAWVDSMLNTSPCIVDIKDYNAEASKKMISAVMRRQWAFCRLMSDLEEKFFGGKKWKTRDIPRILEKYRHPLVGYFRKPTHADYNGAMDDLRKQWQKKQAQGGI